MNTQQTFTSLQNDMVCMQTILDILNSFTNVKNLEYCNDYNKNVTDGAKHFPG